MVSVAAMLGLNAPQLGLPPVYNQGPYYLIVHYVLAYIATTPRTLKQIYGIDNNRAPREDVATVGEAAVKSGKITRQQLDMIKRNSAAHQNTMENYPVFVAAILSAQFAGVPNHVINRAALSYTVARIGYAAAYILIEKNTYSLVRTVFWKIGVLSCMYLLWRSGKELRP